MTLRDRLAAVLGPGNDDATAYAQADAVLRVIYDDLIEAWDDGNATGLDGWAGENAGRGQVDPQAESNLFRFLTKAMR